MPAVRADGSTDVRADGSGETDAVVPGSRPAKYSLKDVVWRWAGELRRRWGLVLVAFVLGLTPMAATAVFAIPTYTATGVVQVTSNSAIHPLLELGGGTANPSIETEIELMRRREFLLAAFKDRHLNVVGLGERADFTLDLGVSLGGQSAISPAVDRARGALRRADVDPRHPGDVSLRLTAVDAEVLTVALGDDGEELHTLRVGEELATPALTLAFVGPPVAPGETVALVVRSDGSLFDELSRALSVVSVGGRSNPTNLVRVSFTASDRHVAQAVVARVMDRYVEQSLEWQTASASRAVEFISTQLAEATDRLAEQEEALRTFAEDHDAVQLDAQAQATIERAAALESERLAAALQEKLMDQVLGSMKRRMDDGKVHLTANFFDDPVLAASVAALTENEVRYELLKATLTPEHPQVLALAAQLKLQQQEVSRLMRSARRNLGSRTRELELQLEGTVSSLDKYPDKQLQLARLMRAVAVSERLYSFLLEKLNDAEILKASTTTDKRVVDAASFPHRKTSPQRGRMLATGLAAGLALAFLAVYIAWVLQRKLGSVEAITNEVSWPVYGTIPAFVAPAGELGILAATWLRGPSAVAEATRALAVNISLSPGPFERGRIILVTSSQPGEGKSTVTANLAVALGRTGARVLLIDLDLRRPQQHRIWGVPREPGYVELTARSAGPELALRVMHRDATHQVTVLTAGTRAADTTALVFTDQLESMLAFWTTEYDYIVLDAPPAFVPDTLIVARHADLLLLLARPGMLERGELRRALDLLARVPASKGLLLNAVTQRHQGLGYGPAAGYYMYGLEDAGDGAAPRKT